MWGKIVHPAHEDPFKVKSVTVVHAGVNMHGIQPVAILGHLNRLSAHREVPPPHRQLPQPLRLVEVHVREAVFMTTPE